LFSKVFIVGLNVAKIESFGKSHFTAIPPSPTAAAQRFTEPERTSPAAKMPDASTLYREIQAPDHACARFGTDSAMT